MTDRKTPIKLTPIQNHQLFDFLIQHRERLASLSDRLIADEATRLLSFTVNENHVFVRRESAGIPRERYAKKQAAEKLEALNVAGAFMRLLTTLEPLIGADEKQGIFDLLIGKRGN